VQPSDSSKGSTIRDAVTHRSAISHRSTTSAGTTQLLPFPTHISLRAVLAALKDKPFGRPQNAAVLDRRSARQPHQRAGRDGRMAPPGAEPKNANKQEDNMASDHVA
jgi:hypothetical protein